VPINRIRRRYGCSRRRKAEDRDVVESYKLGANSYIQKPVNITEVQDAVRQLGLYGLLV